MSNINQFQRPSSPLTDLAAAGYLANQLWGDKGVFGKNQDLINEQINKVQGETAQIKQTTAFQAETNKRENDPTDPASIASRGAADILLSRAKQLNIATNSPAYSSLDKLLNGNPGKAPVVGQEGIPSVSTPDNQQLTNVDASPGNVSDPVEAQPGVAASTLATAAQLKPFISEEGALTKLITAREGAIAKQNTIDYHDNNLLERQDYTRFTKAMNALNSDPTEVKRLNQLQNLSNASGAFLNADVQTPEQFSAWQTALRSNVGIGPGVSAERAAGTFHGLGLAALNWKEMLFTEPQNMDTDGFKNLINHVKQISAIESNNAANSYNKRLDVISSGLGDVFSRNPDYQAAFNDKLKSIQAVGASYLNSQSNQPDNQDQTSGDNTPPNTQMAPNIGSAALSVMKKRKALGQ